MKFSVVIPAHDDQASLDRTVESMMRQTLAPHEIIVVDDGSEYPLSAPRDSVRLVRIERVAGERGSSAAKNWGTCFATGDWLVFSDDDIVHAPDALESIAVKINNVKRPDILINVFSINPSAPIDKDRVAAVLSDKSVFSEQHCGVIGREYFERIGGYDSDSFQSWGYNNQDLSIRVVRSGGLITSNVRSIRTGDLLTCVHCRPSIHDSKQAKADFKRKYGRPFNVSMLTEGQRAAS